MSYIKQAVTDTKKTFFKDTFNTAFEVRTFITFSDCLDFFAFILCLDISKGNYGIFQVKECQGKKHRVFLYKCNQAATNHVPILYMKNNKGCR